jgi:hypothetical protein
MEEREASVCPREPPFPHPAIICTISAFSLQGSPKSTHDACQPNRPLSWSLCLPPHPDLPQDDGWGKMPSRRALPPMDADAMMSCSDRRILAAWQKRSVSLMARCHMAWDKGGGAPASRGTPSVGGGVDGARSVGRK